MRNNYITNITVEDLHEYVVAMAKKISKQEFKQNLILTGTILSKTSATYIVQLNTSNNSITASSLDATKKYQVGDLVYLLEGAGEDDGSTTCNYFIFGLVKDTQTAFINTSELERFQMLHDEDFHWVADGNDPVCCTLSSEQNSSWLSCFKEYSAFKIIYNNTCKDTTGKDYGIKISYYSDGKIIYMVNFNTSHMQGQPFFADVIPQQHIFELPSTVTDFDTIKIEKFYVDFNENNKPEINDLRFQFGQVNRYLDDFTVSITPLDKSYWTADLLGSEEQDIVTLQAEVKYLDQVLDNSIQYYWYVAIPETATITEYHEPYINSLIGGSHWFCLNSYQDVSYAIDGEVVTDDLIRLWDNDSNTITLDRGKYSQGFDSVLKKNAGIIPLEFVNRIKCTVVYQGFVIHSEEFNLINYSEESFTIKISANQPDLSLITEDSEIILTCEVKQDNKMIENNKFSYSYLWIINGKEEFEVKTVTADSVPVAGTIYYTYDSQLKQFNKATDLTNEFIEGVTYYVDSKVKYTKRTLKLKDTIANIYADNTYDLTSKEVKVKCKVFIDGPDVGTDSDYEECSNELTVTSFVFSEATISEYIFYKYLISGVNETFVSSLNSNGYLTWDPTDKSPSWKVDKALANWTGNTSSWPLDGATGAAAWAYLNSNDEIPLNNNEYLYYTTKSVWIEEKLEPELTGDQRYIKIKEGDWSLPRMLRGTTANGNSLSEGAVNKINAFNDLTNGGQEQGFYLEDVYYPTEDKSPVSNKTYYLLSGGQYLEQKDLTQFEKGKTYYEYEPNKLFINAEFIQTGALKVADENGNSVFYADIDQGKVEIAGFTVDQNSISNNKAGDARLYYGQEGLQIGNALKATINANGTTSMTISGDVAISGAGTLGSMANRQLWSVYNDSHTKPINKPNFASDSATIDATGWTTIQSESNKWICQKYASTLTGTGWGEIFQTNPIIPYAMTIENDYMSVSTNFDGTDSDGNQTVAINQTATVTCMMGTTKIDLKSNNPVFIDKIYYTTKDSSPISSKTYYILEDGIYSLWDNTGSFDSQTVYYEQFTPTLGTDYKINYSNEGNAYIEVLKTQFDNAIWPVYYTGTTDSAGLKYAAGTIKVIKAKTGEPGSSWKIDTGAQILRKNIDKEGSTTTYNYVPDTLNISLKKVADQTISTIQPSTSNDNYTFKAECSYRNNGVLKTETFDLTKDKLKLAANDIITDYKGDQYVLASLFDFKLLRDFTHESTQGMIKIYPKYSNTTKYKDYVFYCESIRLSDSSSNPIVFGGGYQLSTTSKDMTTAARENIVTIVDKLDQENHSNLQLEYDYTVVLLDAYNHSAAPVYLPVLQGNDLKWEELYDLSIPHGPWIYTYDSSTNSFTLLYSDPLFSISDFQNQKYYVQLKDSYKYQLANRGIKVKGISLDEVTGQSYYIKDKDIDYLKISAFLDGQEIPVDAETLITLDGDASFSTGGYSMSIENDYMAVSTNYNGTGTDNTQKVSVGQDAFIHVYQGDKAITFTDDNITITPSVNTETDFIKSGNEVKINSISSDSVTYTVAYKKDGEVYAASSITVVKIKNGAPGSSYKLLPGSYAIKEEKTTYENGAVTYSYDPNTFNLDLTLVNAEGSTSIDWVKDTKYKIFYQYTDYDGGISDELTITVKAFKVDELLSGIRLKNIQFLVYYYPDSGSRVIIDKETLVVVRDGPPGIAGGQLNGFDFYYRDDNKESKTYNPSDLEPITSKIKIGSQYWYPAKDFFGVWTPPTTGDFKVKRCIISKTTDAAGKEQKIATAEETVPSLELIQIAATVQIVSDRNIQMNGAVWRKDEYGYPILATNGGTPITGAIGNGTVAVDPGDMGRWCLLYNRTCIDGGTIVSGSITADKLKVNSLEAVSGEMGTLTAGEINGGTPQQYFQYYNWQTEKTINNIWDENRYYVLQQNDIGIDTTGALRRITLRASNFDLSRPILIPSQITKSDGTIVAITSIQGRYALFDDPEVAESIMGLKIAEGITSIGSGGLCTTTSFLNLQTIILPGSLTEISNNALIGWGGGLLYLSEGMATQTQIASAAFGLATRARNTIVLCEDNSPGEGWRQNWLTVSTPLTTQIEYGYYSQEERKSDIEGIFYWTKNYTRPERAWTISTEGSQFIQSTNFSLSHRGDIIANNGIFSGKLQGATGSFSGDLIAKKGQIANFTIDEKQLSTKNLSLSDDGINFLSPQASLKLASTSLSSENNKVILNINEDIFEITGKNTALKFQSDSPKSKSYPLNLEIRSGYLNEDGDRFENYQFNDGWGLAMPAYKLTLTTDSTEDWLIYPYIVNIPFAVTFTHWGSTETLKEGALAFRFSAKDTKTVVVYTPTLTSLANLTLNIFSIDSSSAEPYSIPFSPSTSTGTLSITSYHTLSQFYPGATIRCKADFLPTDSATGSQASGSIGWNLGDKGAWWRDAYIREHATGGSDYNLKTEVVSLKEQNQFSQLFDNLQPVTFKWIDNTSNRTHIGLIAQDVKQAILDSGLTTQDVAAYCEWEKEDGSIGCGLRYGEFIALCIDQIQKLKHRVAELEEQIIEIQGEEQ